MKTEMTLEEEKSFAEIRERWWNGFWMGASAAIFLLGLMFFAIVSRYWNLGDLLFAGLYPLRYLTPYVAFVL